MKKKGMVISMVGFLLAMILCLSGGTFGHHPPSGDASISSPKGPGQTVFPSGAALITPWTRDLPAPKILLVSSAVKDGDILANAAGHDVIVLKYHTRSTSLDALNAMIEKALNGRKASSIAIAAHDYGENRFYLTKSKTIGLGSTLGDLKQRAFWKRMGQMVAQDGRIDLLACHLASGDKGALLMASLESAAGVHFAASTDATGNPPSKGDWILETEGIDLKEIYFKSEKLKEFKGLLWGYEKVLHEDQWVIDQGQDFGTSVSLFGDIALVGAPYTGMAVGEFQGAAYIFLRDGQNWRQQAKLTASDGEAGDYFGYSVSLSGDTALVGAPNAAIDGRAYQGAAYVFKRDGEDWNQQAKLTASDGEPWARLGLSVSLSGDTALVGAPWAAIDGKGGQGAAYILKRDGEDWNQQAKLTASDGEAGDYFGTSVSLSGDTALVGAPEAAIDGKDSQGAAYILKRDGEDWNQQAKLTASDGEAGDYFGTSVSLSGDTALVGAPEAAIDGKWNQGAAYIFLRDGRNWNQQEKLTASDGYYSDEFGTSVSLFGDTALVGAPRADIDGKSWQGAAYVFLRDGRNWNQQEKLTATDGEGYDYFGTSVSLSGDTALVGAPRADIAGQSYIFDGGDAWKEDEILTPPADSLPADSFAYSVSLSGDTALVGAPGADIDGKAYQGAAYVFLRNGRNWNQQAKLTAADGEQSDYFGISVSLSGDTALVGAFGADIDGKTNQGAAYVFLRDGRNWNQQAKLTASDGAANDSFGYSVSLSGDTALVGAPGADIDGKAYQGAAYIFKRDVRNWNQQAKLTASDGAANDSFGYSVSLSGDTALVGAFGADIDGKGNQGAAYIFLRDGQSWNQQEKLTASDGAAKDNFGGSVSLSGDTALVGATDIDGKDSQGAAYIFLRDGQNWIQQTKLTAEDGEAGDSFGISVSLSGDTALVGAPRADINGKTNHGAAYVFLRDRENWTQTNKLTASDGAAENIFGSSVSLSGDHALVGAPGRRHAYVFADPKAPGTQAENIGFNNVTRGQMDASWTRGNGRKILVVARKGSAVDCNPEDGTSYTADAAFGSGGEIGTGNYVVYNGSGTGVTVTGLTADTDYHFRAYEFNDTYTEKYNTKTATGNPSSQTTLPHAPTATAASDITETGFTANWSAARGVTGYFLDVSTNSGFTSFLPGYENRDVGEKTAFAVTGLSTATVYYYRVRAENPGGTSGNSNVVSVTTSDGTGVPADIQNKAPNNGDGNGDGIKDSLQTHVASLPCASAAMGYITLVVTGCDRLENVHVRTCASVGKPDPGYDYPFDLVGFNIPCQSATVRIYYHGSKGLQRFDYRKYGPTPGDWNTSLWYSMPGLTFGSKTIDKRKVFYVEFLLTEAKLGDDTPVFPIVDQGGVALSTAIPTLNEWGIIILSLLMVGMALFGIRRRRAKL